MESIGSLDRIYARSDDIVSRQIEGEIILVPIASGIADMEDSLFTLNETGRAIWERLDGKTTLHEVARELSGIYEATADEIEADVLGLVRELEKRKMLLRLKK